MKRPAAAGVTKGAVRALAAPAAPLSLNQYIDAVDETWFETPGCFLNRLLQARAIYTPKVPDCLESRGVLIMGHYRMLCSFKKCPECGGAVVLVRDTRGWWLWRCSSKGNKCWNQSLNSVGFLTNINVSNWSPFLHFVTMIRHNYRWSKIKDELSVLYGLSDDKALIEWRRKYQTALEKYIVHKQGMLVGGANDVVVFDETNLGAQKGIRKGPQGQRRSSSRAAAAVMKRIRKTLPARTLWKKSDREYEEAGGAGGQARYR